MPKKPVVDEEKCIGCGLCANLSPDVFEMGEDGKAKVKNPKGDSEANIQTAIDDCPVQAISWK